MVRGDVTLDVTARGELRGGNPEVLYAPSTGGLDLHLTSLRTTGEPVKKGEVVAEFDTTEQTYKLKEAEADLAEAEQHIYPRRRGRRTKQQDEEDRYALEKGGERCARGGTRCPQESAAARALAPRSNTIWRLNARERPPDAASSAHNLANRKATNQAAIGIQEAARGKAESQAKTARDNIEAMTLHAPRDGYVSLRLNSTGSTFFGMVLPMFQVGDQVRPGMAIAEIPWT